MSTQREALEALSRAIPAALRVADTGHLFSSPQGYALVNAMHDLTECDALYEMAGDIATEVGLPHEPSIAEQIRAWRQTVAVSAMIRDMNERCIATITRASQNAGVARGNG